MAPQLKTGDRVIIELKNREIFEGTISNITNALIELHDIYFTTTNSECPGLMTFYRAEVLSATIVHLKTENGAVNGTLSNGVKDDSDSNQIHFCPEEFERLKQMALNHIFIDTAGVEFNKAVEVLSNRENVGVVGLGNLYNRQNPLCVLVMCDFKQIYVFDMLCLNKLRGLQDIFENNSITKIVYNGSLLYNTLYHKYNTEMKNIFDIKISETILEPELNTKNLSQCLAHHFNFPESLLSAALDELKDNVLKIRPIIKSNKIQAALLATYLISLKNSLTSKVFEEHNKAVAKQYSQVKSMSIMDLIKLKLKC